MIDQKYPCTVQPAQPASDQDDSLMLHSLSTDTIMSILKMRYCFKAIL